MEEWHPQTLLQQPTGALENSSYKHTQNKERQSAIRPDFKLMRHNIEGK